MLKSLLVSALFAGLAVGLLSAVAQQFVVVPLIVEAELYENGDVTHFAGAEQAAHDHAAHDHGAVAPEDATEGDDHGAHDHGAHGHGAAGADAGFVRAGYTTLFFILIYCGFAMILVAGYALSERLGRAPVTAAQGLIWGIAGFVAVQLAPAFGLAPELPGANAAALESRQIWWIFAAVATAAGIAAGAFGGGWGLVAGAALILAPQVMGAPHADGYAGVVPPELAALFTARSLALGFVSWAALGALSGYFWSRESRAA